VRKIGLVIENLKDEGRRQAIDVLHFACHGSFSLYQPLQSGIQLVDGMLTAEEIFGLDVVIARVGAESS
jgi:CHAT domain-containing protein